MENVICEVTNVLVIQVVWKRFDTKCRNCSFRLLMVNIFEITGNFFLFFELFGQLRFLLVFFHFLQEQALAAAGFFRLVPVNAEVLGNILLICFK